MGNRERWLFWLGLSAPILIFAATYLSNRRRERFALDAGLRRRHHALRRLRKSLKAVENAEAASLCLRQYVGDKLGLEGGALTASEVDQQLRERGVDSDLASSTYDLLQRLEAAQFGGDPQQTSGAVQAIEPLVKSLERQIRS